MKNKWHQKKYKERYKTLGDIAEDRFHRWCADRCFKCEDYGFRRSRLDEYYGLPKVLRYAPDFILEFPRVEEHEFFKYHHCFVEVKGCGKDGLIKIKKDDIWALSKWQELSLPVVIFAHNNVTDRVGFEHLVRIKNNLHEFDIGEFDNNKKRFYKIPEQEFTTNDLEFFGITK